MTHKKIDLALATVEWAQEQSFFKYFDSRFRHFQSGAQKDKVINNAITSYYLADALDVSVDNISLDIHYNVLTIKLDGSLNAKALNRLMNAEIHVEGKVMVFNSLGSSVKTEGDSYMGEYNESHYGRLEAEYRTERS